MQTKNTCALLTITGILWGCSEATPDVEYFLKHPDKRQEVLKECNNNPGDLRDKPICINAGKAFERSFFMPKAK